MIPETEATQEDEVTLADKEVELSAIETLFGILPKTVTNELQAFVDSNEYPERKMHIFATRFNSVLWQQVASMWFGERPNVNFYNLPTAYTSSKDFWILAKVEAEALNISPETMTLKHFMQIARTVIKDDGFSLSTLIYKDNI